MEDKHIDESWKEQAEKEKIEAKNPSEGAIPEMPVPSFNFFITTLALQAAIAMGQIENPATDKKEDNLPQAKFIIDTLIMLKEKTANNLNKEEDTALEGILYELRMNYIEKNK